MEHSTSNPMFDPDLQTILHAELARTPTLRPLVLHPEPDLGPRFVGYWRQISALPRRTRRSLQRRLPRKARRALQRRWRGSLAAVALLLALGEAPALAATLTVAPGVAPDIVPDGFCSLIEAIENANADPSRPHLDCAPGSGADTIVLPTSSIQLLTAIHNSTDANGSNGLPVISSAITIEGNGSTLTRDSRAPAFRILAVSISGNLTLNEATVSGGTATGSGGGIAIDEGTATITNAIVSGNSASANGGGVSSYFANVNVTNSTISGNSAASGGGVRNVYGSMALTDSTVSGNSAASGGGGVSNNQGSVTLTNSTVSSNSAASGGGGVSDHEGIVTLMNSTVAGNSAGGDGGGVLNGGIPGGVTLTNSTVSGNSAGGDGGGVFNNAGLSLTNSTVSGNSAGGDGGGVLNRGFGYLTLSRSLISGNTASDGPEVGNQGTYATADDFNLFGLNGEAGVSGFSPGATDIIPSGPLSSILGSLADNGGPTKTHALVAGSPAVDAVGSGCPPPATDQRGFVRPADGDGDGGAECDVGAFELAARPLPTCETAQPTRGCTVNGVANRLCQGTARGDQIFGTHRDDIIFGLDGNDRINGLSGNDLICGGKGQDILRGKMGRDRVFGGAGDDNLQGGSGNDLLSGEGGKDWLFGDRGDDVLDGGADTDKCQGGANGPTGDAAANCETVFGVP